MNYYYHKTLQGFKKQLMLALALYMLIISISSCTKKSQVNFVPEKPEAIFNIKIGNQNYKVGTTVLAGVYYYTAGNTKRSLLTTATVDTAIKLAIFISDLKEGTVTITKKSGTSAIKNKALVKTNATVQTYMRYTNSNKVFYAEAGTVTTKIENNKVNLLWDVTFRDAEKKEFSSSGSYIINDITLDTRPTSEITDPSPVNTPEMPWEEVFSSTSLQPLNMMASHGDSILFTGNSSSNYLYFSANGSTFTDVYQKLPDHIQTINSIKGNLNKFYVTSKRGIAESVDGVNWSSVYPNRTSAENFGSIAVDSAHNMTLLSGSELLQWNSVHQAGTNGWNFIPNHDPINSKLDYITCNDSYYYAVDTTNAVSTGKSVLIYRLKRGDSLWEPADYHFATNYVYLRDYKDFLAVNDKYLFCVFAFKPNPKADVRLILRTKKNEPYYWQELPDTAAASCNVIKTNGRDLVAWGRTSFRYSVNQGETFKAYAIPEGYILGGLEIAEHYYYIMCYNARLHTGKILRTLIQH